MPLVLEPIKDDILFCFFELQERGLKVSVRGWYSRQQNLAAPEFGKNT
jgi:hypothetical protein